MHGEHQQLSGKCKINGSSCAGDIPNCRSLGKAKPQLCCYLSAIPRKKGIVEK